MSQFYINTNRIDIPNQNNSEAYAPPADYLKIEVKDPITHLTNGKRFTDYAVSTKVQLSHFPGKGISQQLPFSSGMGIFESEFIETRRKRLQEFINSIATHPIIKRQFVFHMFLQSLIIDKDYLPSEVELENPFV
ncbi:hypothetical protein MXB_4270 [Myxobolus squamalis]|nr:hypothetical protein MXB_4270 [Myxobolus squamalis]